MSRAVLIAGAASVAAGCSSPAMALFYGAPPYDVSNDDASPPAIVGQDGQALVDGGPPYDASQEAAGGDAAKDGSAKDADADAPPLDSGAD